MNKKKETMKDRKIKKGIKRIILCTERLHVDHIKHYSPRRGVLPDHKAIVIIVVFETN